VLARLPLRGRTSRREETRIHGLTTATVELQKAAWLKDSIGGGKRGRMMESERKRARHEHVDISVIVVSWNTKEFLRECLRSLWETTHQVTLEVLVVDNGSCDGSPRMVKDEFPLVEVIHAGSNLGFARATNIGIGNSRGRYICLVNSDVVVRDGCIDKMYSYIEEHHSVGILAPRILNADLTLQPSCRGALSPWNTLCRSLALDTIFPRSRLFGGLLMNYWPHDTIRSVDAILGCFWMVRREAWNAVGVFDECFFMYAEDVDWCRRCRSAGWEVVYFPDAEVVHYGGASSSSAPVDFYVEANRSSLIYWKKHHGAAGLIWIYLVILLGEIIRIVRGSILLLLKPADRNMVKDKIRRSVGCVLWLLGVYDPQRHEAVD
jgi:GT2 family glycosyltransferase